MANKISEAFGQVPSLGEQALSGLSGALVGGTEAASKQLQADILADEFAISPYRRFLASQLGEDTKETKFMSALEDSQRELQSQTLRLETLKQRAKKGEVEINGKSIKDLIEDAENRMTSAREKNKKSIKRFNDIIPKKSDLERIVAIRTQIDLAKLKRVAQEDASVFREKKALFDDVNDLIEELRKNRGLLPVVVRDQRGRETTTNIQLEQLLTNLKRKAARIITEPIQNSSFIADDLFGDISKLSGVERIRETGIKKVLGLFKKVKPSAVKISPEDAAKLRIRFSPIREERLPETPTGGIGQFLE